MGLWGGRSLEGGAHCRPQGPGPESQGQVPVLAGGTAHFVLVQGHCALGSLKTALDAPAARLGRRLQATLRPTCPAPDTGIPGKRKTANRQTRSNPRQAGPNTCAVASWGVEVAEVLSGTSSKLSCRQDYADRMRDNPQADSLLIEVKLRRSYHIPGIPNKPETVAKGECKMPARP